jgi:hypothetical protein
MTLVACTKVGADFEDAAKSRADIKSELGLDSQVTFRATADTNGRKLVVTVHLGGAPSQDAARIKARIMAIVERDFRSHVDGVSIVF